MKKETTIAIFFGILLGGMVAVGIIIKNRQQFLEKTKTIAPSTKGGPNRSTAVGNFQNLEIAEPQDGEIVGKNSIAIKGKAEKDSLIVLQSPIKDLVFKNEKKEFSVVFPLALGENNITITAYSKNIQFKPQDKRLKVYYIGE